MTAERDGISENSRLGGFAMHARRYVSLLLVILGVVTIPGLSQAVGADARIKIDIDRTIGEINPPAIRQFRRAFGAVCLRRHLRSRIASGRRQGTTQGRDGRGQEPGCNNHALSGRQLRLQLPLAGRRRSRAHSAHGTGLGPAGKRISSAPTSSWSSPEQSERSLTSP